MSAEGFDVLSQTERYAYGEGHGLMGTGAMLLQCMEVDAKTRDALLRAGVEARAVADHVAPAGADGEQPPEGDTKPRRFGLPQPVIPVLAALNAGRTPLRSTRELSSALDRVRELASDADVIHIAYALVTEPDSAAGRLVASLESTPGAAEYELRLLLKS